MYFLKGFVKGLNPTAIAAQIRKLWSPVLLRDLAVVLTLCMVLEAFVFNIRHFAPLISGAGEIVDVKQLPESDMMFLGAERNAEGFEFDNYGEFEISGLDLKVASIYIDFSHGKDLERYHDFTIHYGDEEHSNREASRYYRIYPNEESSKYINLQAFGKVSRIKISNPHGIDGIHVNDIILNKPAPFRILWGRYFLYSAIIFAAVLIIRKKPFSVPLNQDSQKQRWLFCAVWVCVVLYLFTLMLSSLPIYRKLTLSNIPLIIEDNNVIDQYNADVINAWLKGQVHLDIEPSETLKSIENPYDEQMRFEKDVQHEGWDYAFYNGKFYSYFGAVQILVLSLPYTLITRTYLPSALAVFLFATGAATFLMLIWRQLAFRFMKKMSVGMFTLGQIAVVVCSMLPFLVARPSFYETAGTSALFFVAFGLWFILPCAWESKIYHSHLFSGCMCMALAVGCRPNYLFVSLLVPLILFDKIRGFLKNKDIKKLTSMALAVAIPYVIIGSALMWYNYIRFDSVFEFGNKYMLTVTNVGVSGLLNPLNRIILAGACLFVFIAPALDFSTAFPFIYIENTHIWNTYSGYLYKEGALGILSLPIVWALAGIVYVFKYNNKYKINITAKSQSRTRDIQAVDRHQKLIARLVAAMPVVGIVQMLVISFIGVSTRYQLDFVWLFVLPSLICGYFITEMLESAGDGNTKLGKAAKSLYCFLTALSIIIMMLLVISSSNGNYFSVHNPELYYRFLEILGVNHF